jgi:hypothetical protein
MFDEEFVTKCLDELERMPLRAAVGDGPTNLEKLAYQLLLDSAYIDLKQEAEQGVQHAIEIQKQRGLAAFYTESAYTGRGFQTHCLGDWIDMDEVIE